MKNYDEPIALRLRIYLGCALTSMIVELILVGVRR